MAAEEDDDSHIIASVRRILGEDASRPRAVHGGAAPAPDVYELEPSMMIEPTAAGGAPRPGAAPEEEDMSAELAAWASEWGEDEPATAASEDVSVVPQAAPMLAAQEAEARHPPAPASPPPPEATSPRPAPPVAAPPAATLSAAAPAPAAPAAPGPGEGGVPIVEPHIADAAGHTFGSLRDTLRAQKDAATAATAAPIGVVVSSHAGGPTVEEMIRQELRPLLKAWLDAQLPELVERVVRAEIARIVEQTGD